MVAKFEQRRVLRPAPGGEVQSIVATARGAALWVAAAIGYLVLEAVTAAAFKPGYSYTHNYISDLGLPSGTLARGQVFESPRAYLMHAAFYLQGTLFFAGAVLMVGITDNRKARLFLGTAAANAVGNIVVGTVHSGTVHVAGAVLAIAAGNTAIVLGSATIGVAAGPRWYLGASKVIAALGSTCLLMLAISVVAGKTALLPDGVWERGSVYSITGWQLLTAACLLIPTRGCCPEGRKR
jgi:hypothetical membrane protein